MTTITPPAQIGMPLEMVDTPALLVDLDAYEKNLKKMSEAVKKMNVRLRPHAKTHKCPVIALHQMTLGAVGVCCQKVGEAEAMVYGGVTDVYVSNQIVGKSKIERLVSLAKQANVSVCADHAVQISEYSAVAKENNATLSVYVEVDVGTHRCGVPPGEPALALARQVKDSPGLRFAGLQAYHGRAQHLRTPSEREEAIAYAVGCVSETKALLQKNGIDSGIATGAGTGTYQLEGTSKIFDELQAGSYIFMDVDYGKNLNENGQPGGEFAHSLFVYATVMSRPSREQAVLDVGTKGVSVDCGMPLVWGIDDIEYARASDEHGLLVLKNPDRGVEIGEKLKLIPGHCDPTVNLYDWYVGIRNDRVESLWPISARGAMR